MYTCLKRNLGTDFNLKQDHQKYQGNDEMFDSIDLKLYCLGFESVGFPQFEAMEKLRVIPMLCLVINKS